MPFRPWVFCGDRRRDRGLVGILWDARGPGEVMNEPVIDRPAALRESLQPAEGHKHARSAATCARPFQSPATPRHPPPISGLVLVGGYEMDLPARPAKPGCGSVPACLRRLASGGGGQSCGVRPYATGAPRRRSPRVSQCPNAPLPCSLAASAGRSKPAPGAGPAANGARHGAASSSSYCLTCGYLSGPRDRGSLCGMRW